MSREFYDGDTHGGSAAADGGYETQERKKKRDKRKGEVMSINDGQF